MNLFIFFVILSIVNVIGGTIRSIFTVNGNRWTASIINALYFGFYTVVLVYMSCDLALWQKVIITAVCNFIGVFIVKYFEERARKDKLWKVEATIIPEYANTIMDYCDKSNIPYNYIDITKYYIFNFYCATQEDSAKLKSFLPLYSAKYFVSESKIL